MNSRRQVDTDGEVPFTHPNPKLYHAVFPTIRKTDNYPKNGAFVKVTLGEPGDRDHIGYARILARETFDLGYLLSDPFFLFDTGRAQYSSAKEVLQSFYQTELTEDTEFTVLWLRWVVDGPPSGLFGSDGGETDE